MNQYAKQFLAAGLTALMLFSASGAAIAADDTDTAYNRALDAQEAAGKIYISLQIGRWDNQTVEDIPGSYSVYVPENFEYCSPAVLILTPDGITSKAWLDGETGKAWQAAADSNAISLVVAEPEGGSWNLDASASKRDDEAFLHAIYGKLTAKSDSNPSVFDLNERALYLVGYAEGGTAANKMAMKWPALFAGAAAIGGEAVPAAVAKQFGDEISYPFAEATEAGREDNQLPNREIPVRFWEISLNGASHQADIEYWCSVNGLTGVSASTNDYASVMTRRNGQQELPEQVWYSEEEVAPASLYTDFLSRVQRFVGDPGGYLEWTVSHTNDGSHGFFLSEERVDGLTRRWYTYVPQSYNGNSDVPLVVAMHGYSSAISAFTGDSRWQNVADKYNLIVVFPQAYVNDAAYGGGSCIPVPVWNNYSTVYHHTTYDDPDDVSFIKQLVDKTKSNYKIDSSRVYATGHSNGSAMTWMLAQNAPEYFTAVAPIGFNWGSYPGYELSGGTVDYSGCAENTYVLPVWCMTGSYDVGEATDYSADTKNGKTVSYWRAMNGAGSVARKTTEIRSTRAPHTYNTTTYSGENGAPLVRFTQISNNCHSYMEDIAFMVWEDFFSKYTRDTDGVLYYDGKRVMKQTGKLSDSFADIQDHPAKESIQTAVDELGLLAGVTDTAFQPDGTLTRAMFFATLYRMDVNAQAVSAESRFRDVPDGAYYVNAVNWAVESGIASGTEGGGFSPDGVITREQIAFILKKFAENQEISTESSVDLSRFTDASNVSAYAVDAMRWAVEKKILDVNGSELAPRAAATRAEIAKILVNLSKILTQS